MSLEIERRFLVIGQGWRKAPSALYRQGYLHAEAGCTVRVRLIEAPEGARARLTIKGASSPDGLVREEFEYAIPPEDALSLLALARCGMVEKRRHVLEVDGLQWEVDEFLGENSGLILAEIELGSPEQPFSRPDWLGEEVTADSRYSNAWLAVSPFTLWPTTQQT